MVNIKILVVDDSSTTRKIIRNALLKIGFPNVVEASDGVDAFQKLKEGGFSLILTDWNMPELDGLSFVGRLKKEEEFKQIPVIMITTESANEELVAAMKVGVEDYIVKPFTSEVLQQKLEHIIFK
jgi:two-component system, chemotaxis family, chemotaxis protein CheY